MQVPADHEYQEAVQNPKQSFKDSDLSKGMPELMSAVLPIPKPRSGNFATVYRLKNGSKSWAVRCFTRSIHEDQRLRYDAISRHIATSKLPYFAGFQFLQDGIKVRKNWFPIVKMEWIQGVSLKVYIESNLNSPANLGQLARNWLKLIGSLRKSKIAHGDLQHENVMVVDRDLRLIDYDGMWVPELTNLGSHEKGHPNYQHPARDESFFGPDTDGFSHNVILVSIVALAHDPSLWTKFRGGDECLLFRQTDFKKPTLSKLFQTLLQSSSSWIKQHTLSLIQALKRSPNICPFFEDIPESLLPATKEQQQPTSSYASGADWLDGYIKS